jgi:hypothetical protein
MPELVIGALMLAAAITQRLASHVQPDLVAILKQSATVFGGAVTFTATPSATCSSTLAASAAPEERAMRSGR